MYGLDTSWFNVEYKCCALVNTVMKTWALDRAFIGLSPSAEAEPALGRLDRCDEIGPRPYGGGVIRALFI